MSDPLVSIIVPAYNAEKTIKQCLDSLLSIEYQEYEIIVVEDGSTDRTLTIVAEYKDKVQIMKNDHSGPSHCRNIAVKKAKGDFVAFTDSDCCVKSDWITELMKGFVDDKVASVGGIQLSPFDETTFGKNVQTFFELSGFLGGYIKSTKEKMIKGVSHNPSCNVMYRKELFLDIGGFDEALWPCEDVDLDFRLKRKGYAFMYNSSAIVYHYRPQSFKKLSKMMYQYGVMQGILTRKYGFFRKIQLIPLFLILAIPLFTLNKNLLWIVAAYCFFVVWKTRRIIEAGRIFLFSLFVGVAWNAGFFKGLAVGK